MAAININRSVSDPFYRYKMPRLLAKVEGKGNGIKTVIANMVEIAKALERPPTYPTKYFGCELGAQTNYDTKNERFIVNGEHDANKLQDILDGFIKKFVLCNACENPETTLIVRKNQIQSKCKACGNASVIDPKHKLSTFIIKNPPKTDEKDKKENGSPEEAIAEDFLAEKENGAESNDFDDDWAEPIEDQSKMISAKIGKLILNKDLDKSIEERLDMLHKYFIDAKEKGVLSDTRSLLNEAERLELKTKAPLLLSDVLFDTNVVSQIKDYRVLLLRFTLNDQKAQRHLLGGIEQLVDRHVDVLLPKSAHIVKALYDNDVVEEKVLLAWGAKPSKKYVSKKMCEQIISKAKPVLDWLENAEEDSSSEEDEADGTVEFTDRARYGVAVDANKVSQQNGNDKVNANNVGDVEDADTIDIDEI